MHLPINVKCYDFKIIYYFQLFYIHAFIYCLILLKCVLSTRYFYFNSSYTVKIVMLKNERLIKTHLILLLWFLGTSHACFKNIYIQSSVTIMFNAYIVAPSLFFASYYFFLFPGVTYPMWQFINALLSRKLVGLVMCRNRLFIYFSIFLSLSSFKKPIPYL